MNGKLYNFASIAGTIAALNLGVGFFILDKTSMENPFFPYLIATLISGVVLFSTGILTALTAYKPTEYYIFLKNPEEFIKKYSNLTKTHVVRESAMTMAEIIEFNREVNLRKVKRLNLIVLLIILGTVAFMCFTVLTAFALGVPPPIDP